MLPRSAAGTARGRICRVASPCTQQTLPLIHALQRHLLLRRCRLAKCSQAHPRAVPAAQPGANGATAAAARRAVLPAVRSPVKTCCCLQLAARGWRRACGGGRATRSAADRASRWEVQAARPHMLLLPAEPGVFSQPLDPKACPAVLGCPPVYSCCLFTSRPAPVLYPSFCTVCMMQSSLSHCCLPKPAQIWVALLLPLSLSADGNCTANSSLRRHAFTTSPCCFLCCPGVAPSKISFYQPGQPNFNYCADVALLVLCAVHGLDVLIGAAPQQAYQQA